MSGVSHVGDWDLVETMTGGTYGHIFVVEHRITGKRACAKLERILTDDNVPVQLPIERNTYRHLHRHVPANKQIYFPRVLDFGTQGKFHFIIMTLMKCDLEEIVGKYSERQKLNLLLDSINAVEAIHDAGIVHRDIKPRNICISRGATGVSLIDMGLSKKFVEKGAHIPQERKTTLVGTYRYCSIPAMLCQQSSRRDDMESLVYTFVNVFCARLPWQNLKVPNLESPDRGLREVAEHRREKAVLRLKQTTRPDDLCAHVPACLGRILRDVRILAFMERPNYDRMRAYVKQDM
jgi:serine/threonine protein kinase